jgi:glycosyltransferase involved in cell wall biosynthesis
MDMIMSKPRNNTPPEYSIVVPVYNSEASLKELCGRISSVFEELKESYEIILIDDSSMDNSWEIMKELNMLDEHITIIQLMKNFGQHNAIICGFHHVSGKYIITMDDDLQNPPEEIPRLIDKIKEGYDVVIGSPIIKQDSLFKNLSSYVIRYLNTKIFNKPKDLKLSSFRIMTRAVADEIKALKTPYPYISGMLLSITRNLTNATVRHDERKHGSSTYTLTKLFKLSFNLIINYSSFPLKFFAIIGILVSIGSFGIGAFFVLQKLLVGIPVPGWTSIVVLLSFFCGLQLIILSIMGEYLSRIINEVSNRQQFVIREKHIR